MEEKASKEGMQRRVCVVKALARLNIQGIGVWSLSTRIEKIAAAETHGDDVHVKKLSKEISMSNTEGEEMGVPMPLCQLEFKFAVPFCIVSGCYSGSPCERLTGKQFDSSFDLLTNWREGGGSRLISVL